MQPSHFKRSNGRICVSIGTVISIFIQMQHLFWLRQSQLLSCSSNFLTWEFKMILLKSQPLDTAETFHSNIMLDTWSPSTTNLAAACQTTIVWACWTLSPCLSYNTVVKPREAPEVPFGRDWGQQGCYENHWSAPESHDKRYHEQ